MARSGPAALFRISVGDLCSGRLAGQATRNEGGAWIPGRAARGQEVHRRVEARLLQEHPGARAEAELSWQGKLSDRPVLIAGRADILHPLGLAEEIKTVLAAPSVFRRYRSEQFPGHCMQALLYSWLAGSEGRIYARLRLVNLLDDSERLLKLESTAEELLAWIEVEFDRHLLAQERLEALCGDRRLQAEHLRFPFRELRPRPAGSDRPGSGGPARGPDHPAQCSDRAGQIHQRALPGPAGGDAP